MIWVPSTETFTPGKSRKALHTASKKIGVKVILVPYFSWNRFLFLFLQLNKFVTSTSTFEVTWGLVRFDRTMCSAIIFRMRSISTTSSSCPMATGGDFGSDAAPAEAELASFD